MNLVFVTEARFFKNDRGDIFGDAAFEHHIWQRYLNVFDEIFIVARVQQNVHNTDKKFISSGVRIHFIEIPYYVGPVQYLLKSTQIKTLIKKMVKEHLDSAFICRVPGNMGDMIIKELRRNKKKYGLEVVGDPDDVFSDDSFKHPLKTFFHQKTIKNLKRNISGAEALLYVTKYTLQKKYPPPPNAFTTYASNVMLSTDFTQQFPRKLDNGRVYKVLSVGSLEQMYKAPDVVLEAVKIYNEKFAELPIEFTWLGAGTYLKSLQDQCEKMNISNFYFNGQVSSQEVAEEMKNSDLFVLVSRTEGLPRVIVEAMAQGLPVIGSMVGGIPELLTAETLIEKNKPEALVSKLFEILSNPNLYTLLSKRNLKEAENFDASTLSSRREEFYRTIINNT